MSFIQLYLGVPLIVLSNRFFFKILETYLSTPKGHLIHKKSPAPRSLYVEDFLFEHSANILSGFYFTSLVWFFFLLVKATGLSGLDFKIVQIH